MKRIYKEVINNDALYMRPPDDSEHIENKVSKIKDRGKYLQNIIK